MLRSTLPRLSDKIDQYVPEVIQYQKNLTAIPALAPENGGQGEQEKAAFITQLLKSHRCDFFEEIKIQDSRVTCGYRPNIFAKWFGSSAERSIWILTHMDVVPPGDLRTWETDPFDVVEKDGKLFGRGTEDNHQGFVSSLLAVKALKDLDLKFPHHIGLAVVADEENGSQYGIEAVLRDRQDIFKPNDLILIPDSGDAEGLLIEIAEKSVCWIRVEITGKQAHASVPESGSNAHRAAAHLIVKMDTLNQLFNHEEAMFIPPVSTFEPTKKEANVDNINTIPGSDVFYFDCRVLPQYDLEEIKNHLNEWTTEIEQRFGVRINLSYPQYSPAPPPTSPDAPVVGVLKQAILEVTGKKARTVGIGGGTVAAKFREVGLPAVCWCTVDDTLHGPNEYSRIDNVLTDAKVFAHIFMQE